MKLFVAIFILVCAATARAEYSTNFDTTENPISEGGKWINGQTNGIVWKNVIVSGGVAKGTQSGSGGYDDSIALLTGTWAPDQTVTAVVYSVNQNSTIYEEVECRLRSTVTANSSTGYEVLFACRADSHQYVQIVRWNGPFGNFTVIGDGPIGPGINNGDTVKATAIGNVITAYINGVAIISATDSTYTTGNPGIGFYNELGTSANNADYGFTSATFTGGYFGAVDPARVVTWEGNAGIPGGIPTGQTIWADDCTVAIPGTSLKLVGNGTTDNTSAFAYIIANCPTNQVAKLGSGTFYTPGNLAINRDHIVLRGNGPASTSITGGVITGGSSSGASNSTTLAASVSKGATSFTVASATGFAVGKQVCIRGGEISPPFQVDGYEDRGSSGDGSPAQYYLGTITGVSGTTITVDLPVQIAFATTGFNGATEVRIYTGTGAGLFYAGVGLEDFKIVPNPAYDDTIQLNTFYRSWIKNVEIDTPRNHAIYIRRWLQCIITHCYIHDGTINGSGGGYAITLEQSGWNLIYDNIAKNQTGSFQVNEGSSCNVFAYNYVPVSDYYDNRYNQPDFQNHGSFPVMNLWEGNYGFMALFDNIHGNSAYNTMFRNRFLGYQNATIQYQEFCIAIESFNVYSNAVGNVLGDSHMTTYEMNSVGGTYDFSTKAIYALNYDGNGSVFAPRGNATAGTTLYRHGNWDSVTNGIVWDGSNPDHTLPSSMYLSSKPSFFGNLTWPPFDPATPGAASADDIPAGYRYINGVDPPSGSTPGSMNCSTLNVTNLRIGP